MNHLRINWFFCTIVACIAISCFPVQTYGQQKSTKPGRASESQSPENIGKTSYTPPKSKSRNPEPRRLKSGRTASDKSFVMNEPRGPVNPSERARYYGVGSLELGLNLGLTHGFTDVIGKSMTEQVDFNQIFIDNASPNFGVYARYKINNWFGVSGGFDYATLSGLNSQGVDYQYGTEPGELDIDVPLYERVYSFRNNLLEFSAKMELHTVLPRNPGIGFYGFAGFSTYYSMPEMYGVNDEPIIIPADMNTQGISDSPAIYFALPVGGGASVMVAKFVRIGLEIGYRFTSNHGIDGVYVMDTRYDSYMHTSLKIGYVFPSKK